MHDWCSMIWWHKFSMTPFHCKFNVLWKYFISNSDSQVGINNIYSTLWVSLYDPLLCWGQTTPSTWCNEIMVEMRLLIILYLLNSLTFWCDQVRISPYSISLISCRKVMWIKKNDHLGGYKLFQCQILQNDFIRIAWLTVRRNEMLGSERVVKELSK